MRLEELAKDLDVKTEKPKAVITQAKARRPWLEENEPAREIKARKPEPKHEILDRQLQKIEERTTKLLEKATLKEQKTIVKPSPNHSSSIVKPSSNRSLKKHDEPNYIDYVLMKGIKKTVLNQIEKNIYEDNGIYYSFLDTDEIETESTPNIIRDTIYKLKKENWFEIVEQHYKKRFLKIDIKKYRK